MSAAETRRDDSVEGGGVDARPSGGFDAAPHDREGIVSERLIVGCSFAATALLAVAFIVAPMLATVAVAALLPCVLYLLAMSGSWLLRRRARPDGALLALAALGALIAWAAAPTTFSPGRWRHPTPVRSRYDMAADLLARRDLVGLPTEELLGLLGSPDGEYVGRDDTRTLCWGLDEPFGWSIDLDAFECVVDENGIVVEARIAWGWGD